ncbi:type II toxin-antitoxin system RelE/ParE family toxin [Halomonas sp. TBZ9]|uniref:Type II toxin-antitoxin system RelE/ParE family toxin n=1 Tax=Vreelandella azerica TaxID=2732867 RepID=A0A7Y3TYI9_9GAMM|nr:type II toxin-antitoxin system RelE/ParE family toxin [Halomonas azerica]NOG32597.1 type II toxin-antitoxin system RelE/ParE family toxin [Halomonas azerica]
MIKSFKDRQTALIAEGNVSRKLPHTMQRNALKKLRQLDDLRIPPGNRLESLSGDREGQYSIRINDQWRLCFCFSNGDAYDVEIIDYH